MDEQARRLALIRACLHRRKHYLDNNRNRRCFQCDAFIRPIQGVPLTTRPDTPPTTGR